MDKFLETHNLPGLNHEELENLKRLIMTNKIEAIIKNLGFPSGAVVENLPANAGDTGSSPGQGRSHMPRSK